MIYIDADAIPKTAKELIIKTANRTHIPAIFVANKSIMLPPSPYLSCHVVASGIDVADSYIADCVGVGDIVITSDIPLAYDVLAKGALALNAKGDIYSPDTIAQKRNMRDLMDTLRGTNVLELSQLGQQKPYDDKDKKRFADSLNRLIDKAKKLTALPLSKQSKQPKQSNPSSP